METPVIGSHHFQVLILRCSREDSVGGVYRLLQLLKLARPVLWNSSKNTKTGIMMFLPPPKLSSVCSEGKVCGTERFFKVQAQTWVVPAWQPLRACWYFTTALCWHATQMRWRHTNTCEQSDSLGWIHTVGAASTRLMTQPLVQKGNSLQLHGGSEMPHWLWMEDSPAWVQAEFI